MPRLIEDEVVAGGVRTHPHPELGGAGEQPVEREALEEI
jgi:hypothetical protein